MEEKESSDAEGRANRFHKEILIRHVFIGGCVVLSLGGCSTLRDSLVLGTGSGIVAGAVTGSRIGNDSTENAIKGAVIGGLVGGVASYILHESLEGRDERVRRDTLMNLENYEVMGVQSYGLRPQATRRDGKCYQTREVDGRTVSVPCVLAGSSPEGVR